MKRRKKLTDEEFVAAFVKHMEYELCDISSDWNANHGLIRGFWFTERESEFKRIQKLQSQINEKSRICKIELVPERCDIHVIIK